MTVPEQELAHWLAQAPLMAILAWLAFAIGRAASKISARFDECYKKTLTLFLRAMLASHETDEGIRRREREEIRRRLEEL